MNQSVEYVSIDSDVSRVFYELIDMKHYKSSYWIGFHSIKFVCIYFFQMLLPPKYEDAVRMAQNEPAPPAYTEN